MYKELLSQLPIAIFIILTAILKSPCMAESSTAWRIHDMRRPQPKIVTPPTTGQPPSDAVVLFDGKDLSCWQDKDGNSLKWIVKDGYMQPTEKAGNIQSKQPFGDCQLHIEWAAPPAKEGKGQHRGNSGIFFMGKYEVQILDSYDNITYADGHAGAVYGQHVPQVNASLPPGTWQSYDIIFHAPRFEDGKAIKPATVTVLHNGILVLDSVKLKGPTTWITPPEYKPHAEKLPLALQYHDNPVRFRNIWLRELPANPRDAIVPQLPEPVSVSEEILEKYVGKYQSRPKRYVIITKENGRVFAEILDQLKCEMFAESQTKFFSKIVDVEIVFEKDDENNVTGLNLYIAGDKRHAKKL